MLPEKKENSTAETCKTDSAQLIECIQGNDKFGLALAEKNMTIEQALGGTTLLNLSKEHGEKNILKVVYSLILNVSNYFNVAHSLNNDQALQTATLILDKYPVETVEDFVMCFKLAKRNEFGANLHRIDGTVIFGWCAKYFDLKYSKKDELHARKVSQEKADQGKGLATLYRAASMLNTVRKIKQVNGLIKKTDKVIKKYQKKPQKPKR